MRGRLGRRRLGRSSLAALLVIAGAGAAQTASVSLVDLPFAIEAFRGPDTEVAATLPTTSLLGNAKLMPGRPLVAVWGKGGGAALVASGTQVRVVPWQGPEAAEGLGPEAPQDAIAHARRRRSGAFSAYFAEPRTTYPHGALGDRIEAGRLVITERKALGGLTSEVRAVPVTTATVEAGEDHVFEDLEPRFADLDGDGTPEILVVRSHTERGASLSVVARRNGAWRIVAETPPIGAPKRWLNPAAIAAFAGEGQALIALVRAPHQEGVLQLWSFASDQLSLMAETPGYSNHAFGSTALALAAALDLDGDGRPELVLPTLDRSALAILSLSGTIREVGRVALPARIDRGLAALGTGREALLLAGLEDGRVALVRP
ncbi:MAG TPA: hypothetical protein VIL65_05150 [Beijerinckiaceae bacterium]